MTLGEKLAKLRKENNYTQEELADILNVSRQAVSKWESDQGYPETDRLIKIGKLFDCSMDYLLKDGNADGRADAETDERGDGNIKVEIRDEKPRAKYRGEKVISAVTGSAAIIVTCVYLVMGFVLGAWHPAWILFLLLPIVSTLSVAIAKRKATVFAFPVLVVAIYLTMGFCGGLWHPGWIVFFSIPVYYIIAEVAER